MRPFHHQKEVDMCPMAQKKSTGLAVTSHAIYRRLDFERATEEQKLLVLDTFREVAAADILAEISSAIELTPDARRIFMHPGREVVLGMPKPRVYFDRNGNRRTSSSNRVNDSRYYFTGDVIYVVDNQAVVTCILPDDRQVETIFMVMPEAEFVEPQMREILRVARPHDVVPQLAPANDSLSLVRGREAPPLVDWQLDQGTAWTVVVVSDESPDQDIEGRAVGVVQAEVPDGGQVFIEKSDDPALETVADMLEYFGEVEVRVMPPMPELDWNRVNGKIPVKIQNWWTRMAAQGAQGKQLVTVLTPRTAKALLETAQGSSDAAWRRDSDCCAPGSKFKLVFNRGTIAVARDRY